MNYKQLHQIINDKEEIEQMKDYTKENELEVQDQKERDGLEALDREANSLETQWHGARVESIRKHYIIEKQVNSEGEWHGLFIVRDRKGLPLPKELQGSFTDQQTCINTINAYLKTREITS